MTPEEASIKTFFTMRVLLHEVPAFEKLGWYLVALSESPSVGKVAVLRNDSQDPKLPKGVANGSIANP